MPQADRFRTKNRVLWLWWDCEQRQQRVDQTRQTSGGPHDRPTTTTQKYLYIYMVKQLLLAKHHTTAKVFRLGKSLALLRLERQEHEIIMKISERWCFGATNVEHSDDRGGGKCDDDNDDVEVVGCIGDDDGEQQWLPTLFERQGGGFGLLATSVYFFQSSRLGNLNHYTRLRRLPLWIPYGWIGWGGMGFARGARGKRSTGHFSIISLFHFTREIIYSQLVRWPGPKTMFLQR